ncbi:phosphate signaling complex protein PhoU [Paenibacillus chitinolyticus]|uniref:phosphate signaling complex protein PhoU n=1 Tax=Paenibacillus chitinolyticus TaxID=79263 RepID=UPI00363FB1A9
MNNRLNFQHSIDDLQNELLDLGSMVENSIHQAVEALTRLDTDLARRTVEDDDAVDELTLRIEEMCLKLIALQQPMAGDLRIIGTALSIATDLERIADHAVDIAKITIRLSGETLAKELIDIPQMAEISKEMLRESLVAYMNRNVHMAASLAEKDDKVDKIFSRIMTDVIGMMNADFTRNRQLTHLIMVAHYLERVADHVTNIGESVIYMVTGKRKDLNV